MGNFVASIAIPAVLLRTFHLNPLTTELASFSSLYGFADEAGYAIEQKDHAF